MVKTNLESKATDEQKVKHMGLSKLFQANVMPTNELLISLGLFERTSQLVKYLFLNELYQLILDKPGVIMEFGCWRGQNLVVFENLRAIYEPFNHTRRIIGFDTFKGYTQPSEHDTQGEVIREGNYALEEGYKEYLEAILSWHEESNILGNIKKHEVIAGDVCQTVPQYFVEHLETVVALAYFDMSLYEPTAVCLSVIRNHLIKGSVLMLDEYGIEEGRGETQAVRELLAGGHYSMRLSKFMPGRTIAIIE